MNLSAILDRRHPARVAKALLGVTFSAVFLSLTLAYTDVAEVGDAFRGVAGVSVGLMAALSAAEVAVRALRWSFLLRPLAPTPFATALGYLGFGHMMNALLPARLGDVARAYLTGGRIGASRISVLGTIGAERFADAGLLVLVGAAAMLIGYRQLDPAVVTAIAAGGIGFSAAAGIYIALKRHATAVSRLGRLVGLSVDRLLEGASALSRPGTAAPVLMLTVTSFVLATIIMLVAAAAAGLPLSLAQAAITIALVTLSTAIPAGPASIGTYEFVGVTALASMGFGPERSLVAIVLVHSVATIVPVSIGLVSVWITGVRHVSSRPGRPRS